MGTLYRRFSDGINLERIGELAQNINTKLAIVLIIKKLVRLVKAPPEDRKEHIIGVLFMILWYVSLTPLTLAPMADLICLIL